MSAAGSVTSKRSARGCGAASPSRTSRSSKCRRARSSRPAIIAAGAITLAMTVLVCRAMRAAARMAACGRLLTRTASYRSSGSPRGRMAMVMATRWPSSMT
ncbi:hypothetical protein Tdes44962_MAKER10533 [Teratosphaeria destructans]|uniref:Uncharacterized protein n=1 Tax=Teratosphaeria destructans TaxID=418781 RepID=A0A9W7SYX8_9PEZI|nr:hypothetical protein Tdes44962_MAKER10533 [Teratosphaeria destructans]